MVQAILAGRKTQTRRVIKPQPDPEAYMIPNMQHRDGELGVVYDYNQGDANPFVKCPYGKIGDVIWVRETVIKRADGDTVNHHNMFTGNYAYVADCGFTMIDYLKQWGGKSKPSIHMPKEAARLFLQITSIGVELLNDISEADAIAEGVEDIYAMIDVKEHCYKNYMHGKDERTGKSLPVAEVCGWDVIADDATHSFKTLWQSINGASSWQADPYVWRIEFKVIDKPANFI
jgi:hypothetical protein